MAEPKDKRYDSRAEEIAAKVGIEIQAQAAGFIANAASHGVIPKGMATKVVREAMKKVEDNELNKPKEQREREAMGGPGLWGL